MMNLWTSGMIWNIAVTMPFCEGVGESDQHSGHVSLGDGDCPAHVQTFPVECPLIDEQAGLPGGRF